MHKGKFVLKISAGFIFYYSSGMWATLSKIFWKISF